MKAPCGIGIFLLVAATLAAQDVVRVDPQHYKVLFENSHIRVIEGRDRPGDITPMHHHPAYLSYLDGPVKAKIVSPDGSATIYGPGDDTWCSPPTTHSTENVGTTNTHEVAIEFKDFDPCGDSSTKPEVGSNAKELVTAANPGDVNTIDGIIAASYAALSGPVGTPRQWARYFSLLDPQARLVSASVDAATGEPKIVRWNREEYAAAASDYLVNTGFVDRGLGCVTNQYGNVAAVRCGFEGLEQSKLVERGVAIYQLYNDGKRWWITSVVWDQERPGNPLPAELLTKK